MPAVVEVHSAQLPPAARRTLTRADCSALEAAGLLDWERFELIDGALIRQTPKSRLQTNVLRHLCAWLRRVFGEGFVDQEVAIDLRDTLNTINAPEPDAIVLRRPAGEFRTDNPGAVDLLFVAEVAVTSQDYDLGAKAALYANAGIAEYWVLDLQEMRIVVHRNPAGERYESIIAYSADEAVSPLAAAASSVRLLELVP